MKSITCRLPQIHDYDGNLDREWFVYYSYFNPETGKMQRIKLYKGINIHKTLNERRAAAKKLCDEYTAKLQGGFNPFDRSDVLYTAHTVYQRDEWMGRAKSRDFSIEYYLNRVLDQKKILRDKNHLAVKTFQAYLTKARSLCAFLKIKKWEQVPVQLFSTDHARAYMDNLWNSIDHAHTWCNYLSTMRMLWNDLAKLYPKLMLKNPWTAIEAVRYESSPAKAFNSTQIEKIKKHLQANDPYMLLICEVIYYCFIRPCKELTGLQVKDIDYDHNCFIVPGIISKNKRTQPVKIPKQLMDKLKALNLAAYPENFYLFTRFSEPHPERSGRDYFSKRFKKVMVFLGFGEGYSIYSWKHTGNRKLAESNVPIKFAQLQNRHHSLEQTNTYQQSLNLTTNSVLYDSFPDM